jgi:hypothetical protein
VVKLRTLVFWTFFPQMTQIFPQMTRTLQQSLLSPGPAAVRGSYDPELDVFPADGADFSADDADLHGLFRRFSCGLNCFPEVVGYFADSANL